MARERGSDGHKPPVGGSAPASDTVRRELQELFGLSMYESRLLMALLRAGTSDGLQLSREAEVPRTSAYQTLEALSARGLVEPMPGDGKTIWTSPGWEEVLARLDAAHRQTVEERMSEYATRAGWVREQLAHAFVAAPPAALPAVRFLRRAAHVKREYEHLISEARSHLVMFTRPPYASPPGWVNPFVIAALQRGVTARVVYEEGHDDRPEFAAYHAAGAVAHVVPLLPLKLVVFDSRAALIGVDSGDDNGYPSTMLIDQPGFVTLLEAAFEQYWNAGRLYTPPTEDAGAKPASRRRKPK